MTTASNPIKNNFFKGIAWFILSLMIGVGLDVIQKHLGGALHSFEITFFRFSFGALTLLPFLLTLWIKKGFSISPYWKIHAFRGLLLFAGMVLWCYGLTLVPISTAIALNYSIPFFTLILSVPFLGEHVNRDRWIATLVGFIGVIIVLNPTDVMFDQKTLSILFSSFLFALLDVFNKKYVCKESMLNMLFYTALFTSLLSLTPAALKWTSAFNGNLLLLVALGIGANLLFYCLLKALKHVDASALAPFRYTDFLVSALFGFLFFQEKPTQSACLGFMIIVPTTCYLAYKENRKAKQPTISRKETETCS